MPRREPQETREPKARSLADPPDGLIPYHWFTCPVRGSLPGFMPGFTRVLGRILPGFTLTYLLVVREACGIFM